MERADGKWQPETLYRIKGAKIRNAGVNGCGIEGSSIRRKGAADDAFRSGRIPA